MKKNLERINEFEKNFNSFSEMYFESMMIFNSCLTYKNSINKPKGVIELSVNLHKYNSRQLYESYKNEFKDIKIINLTRSFDDLINSMVSQNLHHYKFNILNYKNTYLDYIKSIETFKGLNIDFKNIFQPNTEKIINKLSEYRGGYGGLSKIKNKF